MTKWFRFYADAMRNPKVAKLSDREFRLWVQVLSVASENEGRVPPADELKHMLNARLDHLLTGLERLISGGLIDRLADGYEPHNWGKFQYKSDTSTDRVKAHRSKGNVSVTPPEAEQKQIQKEEIQTIAPQHTTRAAPSSDLDQLMDKLLLAAGISGFREERAPGLVSLAPVLGLLEQGYSLEGDILPVIRDISRRGKRPGSWKYFVNPVIEAAAAKRSIPQKPTETAIDWSGRLIVFFTSNTWAAGWGPKPDEPGCKAPLEAIDHARTTVGRAA